MKLRLWLSVAGIAATSLTGGLRVTASGAPACTGVRHNGAWTTIDAPTFSGDTTVGGTRYNPGTEGRLVIDSQRMLVAPGPSAQTAFASDQSSILATFDGGCSWQSVYSIDPRSLNAASLDATSTLVALDQDYSIQGIASGIRPGGARTGKGRVYALLTNLDHSFASYATQVQAPVFIASSADGGKTWHTNVMSMHDAATGADTPVTTSSATGDQPNGLPLLIAPSNDSVGYVVIPSYTHAKADGDLNDAHGDDVYVTRDGGVTWTYQSTRSASVAGNLRIDPADPATVWAFSNLGTSGSLQVSHDFAHTWSTVSNFALNDPQESRQVGALNIYRSTVRQPATVLVTFNDFHQSDSTHMYHPSVVSRDGGRSWTIVAEPVPGLPYDVVDMEVTSAAGDITALINTGEAAKRTPTLCTWPMSRRVWTCQPVPLLLNNAETAAASEYGRAAFTSFAAADPARQSFLGANDGDTGTQSASLATAWVLASYHAPARKANR